MSPLGSLGIRDLINGAVVAAFSAALGFLQQVVSTGKITRVDWNVVAGVSLAAALAYILKNLGTTSEGKTLGISATAPKL